MRAALLHSLPANAESRVQGDTQRKNLPDARHFPNLWPLFVEEAYEEQECVRGPMK